MPDEVLKPCPFCGGKAIVESVEGATTKSGGGAWSVGCTDEDGHCYGYQSLTSFERRSDAITAWNKRYNEGKVTMAKLGATGKFPDGKLNRGDEGELRFAVGHRDGLVGIDFGKPVAWLAMPPDLALQMAKLLTEHAEKAKKG